MPEEANGTAATTRSVPTPRWMRICVGLFYAALCALPLGLCSFLFTFKLPNAYARTLLLFGLLFVVGNTSLTLFLIGGSRLRGEQISAWQLVVYAIETMVCCAVVADNIGRVLPGHVLPTLHDLAPGFMTFMDNTIFAWMALLVSVPMLLWARKLCKNQRAQYPQ